MKRNGGVTRSDLEKQAEEAEGSVGGGSKPVRSREKSASNSKDRGNWSKIMGICDPSKGPYLPIWNMIFVISCVLAVSLDPLFFYILIIDQHNKCLQTDKVLSFVTLLLRSLTDVIFLVHIIIEIYVGVTTPKVKKYGASAPSANMLKTTPPATKTVENLSWKSKIKLFAMKAAHKMPWFSVSLIVDVLSLLPIPQLLIVLTFNHKRGSGYLEHRKTLNVFLLGQYLPRVLRIHLSSRELKKTTGIWIKSLFNFFLYILASHVLGAFWYFFSIQRETSCWHRACVDHSTDPKGCMNTFYCNGPLSGSRNLTFLNQHCPIDTPEGASAPFDFGIFLDSLKNNNTDHIKFGKKFFYSFWWGLRNLSNFGTNLTTTTYVWENLFAILISIIGLLLFLYLIGNLQTFMQMEAQKSEEIRQKIKMRKLDILTWISRNKLPDDIKKEIMDSIKQKSKKDRDAVLQDDLFSILPPQTRKCVKRCLCLEPLKTVPMLENMDDKVLRMMCDFLKPVMYNENSFPFRMGDPLDRMLFIIEGTMWTYSTTDTEASSMASNPLKKGQFYGEELLRWASSSFSDFPISTRHVKSQTKVEAFALMAMDLAIVVEKYQRLWNVTNCRNPQEAKEDMARSTINQALRRLRNNQHVQSPRHTAVAPTT